MRQPASRVLEHLSGDAVPRPAPLDELVETAPMVEITFDPRPDDQ